MYVQRPDFNKRTGVKLEKTGRMPGNSASSPQFFISELEALLLNTSQNHQHK